VGDCGSTWILVLFVLRLLVLLNYEKIAEILRAIEFVQFLNIFIGRTSQRQQDGGTC